MKTLVLKLRGPLQSWGSDSRYHTRSTHTAPTKSGVLGLLAAAQGRYRTDNISDLAGLEFAVRIDQPGNLERDYQAAREPGAKTVNLSTRYYLSDAIFLVAVSGSDELIESLAKAVKSPVFPLYLGRRNCPANHDIFMNLTDLDVEEALRELPWQASTWYRKRREKTVYLPIVRDARTGEDGDLLRDSPLSFSQENRQYSWRTVFEASPVVLDNEDGTESFDPFFEAVRSQ
ncbi:type I-E CRISPR-associated protein Cas5/CasD [Rothia nasimurium]|uniref:type I-E CRISPR-associated protein Cas5/CasD n=1 Tax=Rothia nasimurium TaxID=85336 RepID=UPI002DD63676|nr:type I-E CRISPR-associated protein Cas5/CasD [Rothia nasimurium]